jgi:hypothetical protein
MSNQYDYCFYDRNGKPITLKDWSKEFGNKFAFKKETNVNGLRILTKWTGVDMPEYEWMVEHGFSVRSWKPNNRPQIFVSYVWNEDHQLLKSKRYAKIEHAYEGHAKLIKEAENMDFGVYYSPVEELEDING